MTWDKYEGFRIFSSNEPVDMDSPPTIGETARISKEGYEFDVEISSVSDFILAGVVRNIGPEPALEALGVKRGDIVNFNRSTFKLSIVVTAHNISIKPTRLLRSAYTGHWAAVSGHIKL